MTVDVVLGVGVPAGLRLVVADGVCEREPVWLGVAVGVRPDVTVCERVDVCDRVAVNAWDDVTEGLLDCVCDSEGDKACDGVELCDPVERCDTDIEGVPVRLGVRDPVIDKVWEGDVDCVGVAVRVRPVVTVCVAVPERELVKEGVCEAVTEDVCDWLGV